MSDRKAHLGTLQTYLYYSISVSVCQQGTSPCYITFPCLD